MSAEVSEFGSGDSRPLAVPGFAASPAHPEHGRRTWSALEAPAPGRVEPAPAARSPRAALGTGREPRAGGLAGRRLKAPVRGRARTLFAVQPPDGCAPAYRNLFNATRGRAAAARELCEQLWREFSDLADDNFVERFAFEFHRRWFEMYLGAALRRAGLNPTAPKPGPDLQVLVGGTRVHIEATVPTAGHPLHADAVHEPVYRDAEGRLAAIQVPHDQITLRLASAFRAKADVFDRYRREGRVAPDEPCIIAINLREIPHAWADANEFWFRAYYGLGNRFVAFDRSGGATTAGREHRTLLQRAGGAVEDVAPLLNPERAGVCGVLGSSTDAGNVPNPLGDDFTLMPHTVGQSPYPRGFIRLGTEVMLQADGGDRWTVETVDYGAHEPRGPEKVVAEVGGKAVEAEWTVAGRILSVRVGGRGYEIPLGGGDDPAAAAGEIATEIVRIQSQSNEP
jgi:hypothetical protein